MFLHLYVYLGSDLGMHILVCSLDHSIDNNSNYQYLQFSSNLDQYTVQLVHNEPHVVLVQLLVC